MSQIKNSYKNAEKCCEKPFMSPNMGKIYLFSTINKKYLQFTYEF